MTLRTNFDDLTGMTPEQLRQVHQEDHLWLHRVYNSAVFADEYDSLQDAVDAAAAQKLPRVILNPTKTYTISQTLIIPPEICIDGGGRGLTSLASTSPRLRARIVASGALDPMIQLSHFSSLCGCYIDGGNVAIVAIFGQDTNYNIIQDNMIARCGTGIKFGGALFTTLRNNLLSNISGYGLDALDAYSANPENVYYGVNVCLSERNEYKGAEGLVRVEGILTSIADDFESDAVSGAAMIEIGGTVQSQAVFIAPYIEVKKGDSSITVFRLENSTRVSIRDGQAYGDTLDTEAVFVSCNRPATLNVSGMVIARFATVYAGEILPTLGNVSIHGNIYRDATIINALANLGNAESVLMVLPGTKVGI